MRTIKQTEIGTVRSVLIEPRYERDWYTTHDIQPLADDVISYAMTKAGNALIVNQVISLIECSLRSRSASSYKTEHDYVLADCIDVSH